MCGACPTASAKVKQLLACAVPQLALTGNDQEQETKQRGPGVPRGQHPHVVGWMTDQAAERMRL
jgi:hypothetical protein